MSIRRSPLAEVRAAIARLTVDECESIPARLGTITLRSHQRVAAARLAALIDANGGAMLAEPVGVGKTFTALAVAAARGERILIATPAALRAMWTDALRDTELSATIVTHEALSRGMPTIAFDGLVIVDEAHRLRTPATRRYAALGEQCRLAKVLLVTATPVQNRRSDLAAQLALFLGRVVWDMSDEELARHVVRGGTEGDRGQPGIDGPHRVALPVEDDCLDAILALPPPIPARDETLAVTLLTYGLVHQWTSSRAALVAALNRRRARGVAMLASVETGRRPTREEMKVWTHVEGAVQLAFPESVTDPSRAEEPLTALAESLRQHDDAIGALLSQLRSSNDPDRARANVLRRIRTEHPGERIIAFCQYTETVLALRALLAGDPGVAALTARGARVAGGRISRDEVIAQFAPRARDAPPLKPSERIDVLITTDLLSEGLNLQEASVIVHLDLPWNPARLDQRVGRARRLGSRHGVVSVYVLSPPASAERMLRIEARLRDKLCVAQRTIGVAGRILPSPFGQAAEPAQSIAEQLGAARAAVKQWLAPGINGSAGDTLVAAAKAEYHGWLALIRDADGTRLVVDAGSGVEQGAAAITRAAVACNGVEACVSDTEIQRAYDDLQHWLAGRSAAASIDLHTASAARSRRTALARVARALARAPRHQRARLVPLAAVARAVATAPMPEGAERILELLVESELPDEAWLRSIAAFGELNARPKKIPRTQARCRRSSR